MKNPVRLILICCLLVACPVFANPEPVPVVEVGKTYVITLDGLRGVKGVIVRDLGEGWFEVEQSNGKGKVSVNIKNALIVERK